jgi:glycosyltransferase involved in cell wall biosynthesis
MPVRVLYVIDHLAHGGAELLVKNIAENINDEKLEVIVCALRTNPAAISIRGNVINLKYNRCDPRSIFGVARLCKEHSIDILHAHLSKSVITCLLASYICKRPVIVHEHGGIFRKGLSFSVYRFLLRLLHRRAAMIIANSQATARELVRKAGEKSEGIEVIQNTIDFDIFDSSKVSRSAAREKLGISDKDIVVGYVGRLHPLKGADILIEAFSLLLRQSADYLLVLAGDGPQRESLEALVARLGIGKRVKFLGMSDNVAEVMAAFDIGVVPSRQESFGVVAAELMRMKVPVVSSGEEGLAELVSDDVTGLVTRKNVPDEICRCVQRLADDTSLRQRLTEAAYEFSGRFGLQEYLSKLRDVYIKVLGPGERQK